jgi:hypothetical protein
MHPRRTGHTRAPIACGNCATAFRAAAQGRLRTRGTTALGRHGKPPASNYSIGSSYRNPIIAVTIAATAATALAM